MATTVEVRVRDDVRGLFDHEVRVGEEVMRDAKKLLRFVNECTANVFEELNADICTCGGVGFAQHIVGCPVLGLVQEGD